MRRRLLGAGFLALALIAAAASPAIADTLTVQNTGDSGAGSLRQTIADAMPNDTIVVPASGAHYMVTSAPITINAKPLTIAGAGPASSIIDAAQNGRIFVVTGGSLTLTGLTLTNGKSGPEAGPVTGGGAIKTNEALTVSDSAFTNNSATVTTQSNNGGGAIFSNGGTASPVTVTRTEFSNNAFTLSGGTSNSGGGAIFTNGAPVTATQTAFIENQASINGTSNNGGGAIYTNSGDQTYASSAFTANTLTISVGSANDGGGAVYNNGDDIVSTGDRFEGNTASLTLSGGNSGGGAISSNGGAILLAGTEVNGNVLTGTSGAGNSGGGGVFSNGGVVSITRSSIGANRSSLAGTSGLVGGGGVYNGGGTTTVSSSTISGNVASPTGSGPNRGGGGVFYGGNTTATVSSTTFGGNSADAGAGAFHAVGGTTTLKNSVLAGSGPNCGGGGTFASAAGNVESGATCGLAAPGDRPSVDPRLGPLGDHGGATRTQMLLAGSPALDFGQGCPGTDQRGVARPQGAACDSGATEDEPPSVETGTASGITPTSAILAALVTPRFSETTLRFDYGTTTAYGSTSPGTQVGPVAGPQAASVALGGLTKNTLYHFRAVVVNALGIPVIGADQTFRTPSPVTAVTRFGMARTRFRVAPRPTAVSTGRRRRPPRGSSFRYTLSQPSTVRIAIERVLPGRRVGRRCRRPTRRLQRRRRCTRYVLRATLTRTRTNTGRNTTRFTGRIGRRRLAVGRYRASITALAPGAPSASAPRRLRFTILRG